MDYKIVIDAIFDSEFQNIKFFHDLSDKFMGGHNYVKTVKKEIEMKKQSS